MLKFMGATVFAAALLLAAGAAQAASFDCKKAASRIEHLICDDISLSSLDAQLQGAYAGALDRSLHREDLRGQQRAWMKQREGCSDVACLTAAYRKQIAVLSALSDEPAICAGGSTPEVNACGAEYSRRADAELARYVAASRDRLLREAQEAPTSGAPGRALAGFDASQTAWVAYRKAECGAVYEWWSDGTIRGAEFEGCWVAVTKARTRAIWETWLSFMDDEPPLLPEPSKK